jgi:hypothetical protein
LCAVSARDRFRSLAVECPPPQTRDTIGRRDEDDLTFIRRDGCVENLLAGSKLGAGRRRERQAKGRAWIRRYFAEVADGWNGEDHDRHEGDRDRGS